VLGNPRLGASGFCQHVKVTSLWLGGGGFASP